MSKDQIEEIKSKLDIVSVVREYVPSLKKNGRNHFGLCPFHNERTPSFSVNEELGIFKCFGCGEGGDVISFIEKVEGLDFIKALEIAAKKAGVELKIERSGFSEKRNKERERLIEANHLAAEYYHYLLGKHEYGKEARKYAKSRGLRVKELKQFMIGFAPSGYENLKNFLKKKGYTEAELLSWGLLAEKSGHTYDKFRNRLMFPITNHIGEFVGFSGRILDKNSKAPKYLNSPETLVYKKSQIVFGLYQAKEAIRKQNAAILVEGNIDILSSHMVDVQNIVAPLGTALTQEQLKLIKRYSDNIIFAFDTDSAGEKALLRGHELAESLEMHAKVVDLNGYQDVDELIQKGGDWKKILSKAEPVVDHMMNRLKRRIDMTSAEGKDEYVDSIITLIATTESSVRQAHYLERLSVAVGVDVSELKTILNKYIQKSKKVDINETSIVETKEKVIKRSNSRADLLVAALLSHRERIRLFDLSLWSEILSEEQTKILEMAREKTVKELFVDLNQAEQERLKDIMLLPVDVIEDEGLFMQSIKLIADSVFKDFLRAEIRRIKFANLNEQEKGEILNKLVIRLQSLQ